MVPKNFMENVIINTTATIKLPHSNAEKPPELELFPIKKEPDKISFLKNRNTNFIGNIEIKPFLHDISSLFGVVCIYNEVSNRIETYEINQMFQISSKLSGKCEAASIFDNIPQFLWSSQIQSKSIQSIKIIENTEYPLICINSAEGISMVSLKNAQLYQNIEITNGGNLITKWSKSRPNEIVNLSSNHTLFTYNFLTKEFELIYSDVSCFTITTKGHILFISEDYLFQCTGKHSITFKKRIFPNNISIVNVYQDKAFIISIGNDAKYIFSLYNYENNKLKSFYFENSLSKKTNLNDCNVASSIYHTLVLVALRDQEKYLYFNAEDVNKFELLDLKDENSISIPIDDDFEFEKINGFYFLDNIIDELAPFPSTVHFYGKNTISFYNVSSLSFEEPWPYPFQIPVDSCISFNDMKDPLRKNATIRHRFVKPQIQFSFRKVDIFNQENTASHNYNLMKSMNNDKDTQLSSDQQEQSSNNSRFGK